MDTMRDLGGEFGVLGFREFWVQGLGFRVLGLGNFGSRVQGSGIRVLAILWLGLYGLLAHGSVHDLPHCSIGLSIEFCV